MVVYATAVFLKTLTIKGFKSFADTTSLHLEPGVTVIVGPNGSGKSNIVDAVAWVLGSQAPSTIRSSKMDDVIFAGTSKRPALGRAEVALTIDNSTGVLPIEFTEVTISRTLFRSGDSEYAINGVPCRLLDIQELLSDTGVGRHQHVIVSQGHLDAVLQARPEDRRFVIEEAAGVLKYRRRREKAQRRLEATEANLTRLGDLLREVRRQLRPLERQADAARRHGALIDELRAIRMYLVGQELSGQRTKLSTTLEEKQQLGNRESVVRGELAELDTQVMRAEIELTAQGQSETSDQLVRVEGLRQRARGMLALLQERKRSIARELDAFLDQELIASLEADASRLKEELRTVESEAADLAPRAEELASQETALVEARNAFETEWADLDFDVATDAAERRGELQALETAVESLIREREQLGAQQVAIAENVLAIQESLQSAENSVGELEGAMTPLRQQLNAAQETKKATEQAESGALEALRSVEAELAYQSARAETLQQTLDATKTRAGVEAVQNIDGVVGTLGELLKIDSGWESAVEAALGEALTAIVMRNANAARSAVNALQTGDIAGSVLALDVAPTNGASSELRQHVRSDRSDLNALLDALLSGVSVANGLSEAIDQLITNPTQVIVTRSGERLSRYGWRSRGKSTVVTQAAVDEARRDASAKQQLVDQAKQTHELAVGHARSAREAELSAKSALEALEIEHREAQRTQHNLESQLREITTQRDDLSGRLDGIAERLVAEGSRVEELQKLLPVVEASEASSHERAQRFRNARASLEERSTALATLRTDLEVRAAGIEERRGFISTRLAEINTRLERHQDEREEAARRRQKIEARANATQRLAEVVEERVLTLDVLLAELQSERAAETARVREAADALDGLRRSRSSAERQLGELQARSQRLQIEEAEAELRIEALVEQVRNEFDVEPVTAMAAELPEIEGGESPAARARELERELKIMGPINPLALEEFETLSERNTFLEAQLEDVKNSRKELQKVIREVDAEIVQVFTAAYADVSENFTKLFEMLFPGGTGQIRLTDPDNLLETGIEIEAKPSGKNLRKLSLLSGGERSLTALAFLFAVFRSRPSPFYLMDEVEAALDDVNLQRFLHLVEEFRNEAQLLVVSHQKRTMEAGDALYGVSMKPGESSKVISERVRETATA